MNRRDANLVNLIKVVASRALSMDGGKVGGKSLVALVVVGLVVLAGFIAYRLLMIELITNLRH